MLEGHNHNTWQRECILQCLAKNADKHLTIQDIEWRLRQQHMPVSVTTIYRHLNRLVDLQIVRKFKLDGQNCACYQYVSDQNSCVRHFHLICSGCSRVVHFENDKLSAVFKDINKTDDFEIDSPRTVFYGLCGSCVKNKS